MTDHMTFKISSFLLYLVKLTFLGYRHWLNSDLIPRLLEIVEFRNFFMAVLFIIKNEAHTKILRCVGVSVGEFCT